MNVDWERRGQLVRQRQLTPQTVEALVESLKEHGLRLKEADFRGGFGSWYFVMCGRSACVRATFDGRDGFLSYDRWIGAYEYEVALSARTGEWSSLLVLDPDETSASAWTPQAITERMLEYATGV